MLVLFVKFGMIFPAMQSLTLHQIQNSLLDHQVQKYWINLMHLSMLMIIMDQGYQVISMHQKLEITGEFISLSSSNLFCIDLYDHHMLDSIIMDHHMLDSIIMDHHMLDSIIMDHHMLSFFNNF